MSMLHRMIYLPDHYKGNSLVNSYKPVARDLPCDIHLINLRTMVAVSFSEFFLQISDLANSQTADFVFHWFVWCFQPPKSSTGNGANPSDKVALVLHRQVLNLKYQFQINSDSRMKPLLMQFLVICFLQGFTSCYRPLGMTCSTNGGKISVDELFPELFRWFCKTNVGSESVILNKLFVASEENLKEDQMETSLCLYCVRGWAGYQIFDISSLVFKAAQRISYIFLANFFFLSCQSDLNVLDGLVTCLLCYLE